MTITLGEILTMIIIAFSGVGIILKISSIGRDQREKFYSKIESIESNLFIRMNEDRKNGENKYVTYAVYNTNISAFRETLKGIEKSVDRLVDRQDAR